MAEWGWVRVDLLVIGAEGLIVHVEEENTTLVGMGCYIELLGYRRAGNCWVIVVWCRQSEIVLTNVSGLALCIARKASYIAAFAIIVKGFGRMRHGICVGILVIDSGQSVGVVGSIAIGAEIRTHPEGRVGCAYSLHDDIGTLTNTESNHIGSVWHDGHKIVGEYCHCVTIYGETLNAFSAVVDKP